MLHRFKKILTDIKSLKIQGATNVAKAAVDGLSLVAAMSTEKNLKKNLVQAALLLTKTRPTEPALRNILRYLLTHTKNKKTFSHARQWAQRYFSSAEQKTIAHGLKKIKTSATLYTHCHSSTVTHLFIAAHKKGKKIRVCNTETRPLLQGRKTAAELTHSGIHVDYYDDDAVKTAMLKSSVAFLGADAITPTVVYNKVGSSLVGEYAHAHQIPLYICTCALKFDPAIIRGKKEVVEERNPAEVWARAPRGVHVHNPAFDAIDGKHIAGIISELGIHRLPVFIKKVKKAYPWLV
ncbi:MAG: translation initiation factor eIF-2B subunit [Candidatus Woesearchaeota archaeon]|nr:translation initiation factor eIF-2B subunit [Candidatus Woesearchaeota archaeon]